MFIDNKATASHFEKALEQMYVISDVKVSLYGRNVALDSNYSICSARDTRYVDIVFLSEFGNLPLLKIVSSTLRNSIGTLQYNITKIQSGTKEDLECSGQGICNNKGICSCMPGFTSSNGSRAAAGERGDCTYWNPLFPETLR